MDLWIDGFASPLIALLLCEMKKSLSILVVALKEMGYRPYAVTSSGYCFTIEDIRRPFATPPWCQEDVVRVGVATGANGFKSIKISTKVSPPLEHTYLKFFELLRHASFDVSKIVSQVEASDVVHFFYRTDTLVGKEALQREWGGETSVEIVSGGNAGVSIVEPKAFIGLMDLDKLSSEEELKLFSLVEEFIEADCNLQKCLSTNATKVDSFEEPLSTVHGPFEFFTVASLMKLAAIPRPPKMLNHLVRKGELSVLFSSPGVGKSTFALQLAVNVANGTSIDKTHLTNEHEPATVLYFDLENSKRVISERIQKGFSGHDRLHLVKQAVDSDAIKSPLGFVKAIQVQQERIKADLIVIDNLSCFYMDGEKKSEANKLITPIHELAQSGPAVLAIAHTPKRQVNTPISLSDLSGSAQFGNRPDHVFALNATSTAGQVYLIEFKAREDQKVFEHEVLVMSHAKTEYGRGFVVEGIGLEQELLSAPQKSKLERNREIVEHYKGSKSSRLTAEHFGMGKSQIAEIIKQHS